MLEIRDCENYEVVKELFLEYSQIKGAESCFISLDKELADLEGFYKGGRYFLDMRTVTQLQRLQLKILMEMLARLKDYILNLNSEEKATQEN